MSDQQNTDTRQKEKTEAQRDYENGQEFLKNKDTAQAANAFHNALIEFEQENNEAGVANAADKLGDICAEQGDIETAFTHYDRAYAICEKLEDPISLFSLDKKKAKLMADAKEYDKAIAMYLEILDEYRAQRNPQGSVDTLEILADVYLDASDREKAADCYRMIASIHQNFKHNRIAKTFLQKADEVKKG